MPKPPMRPGEDADRDQRAVHEQLHQADADGGAGQPDADHAPGPVPVDAVLLDPRRRRPRDGADGEGEAGDPRVLAPAVGEGQRDEAKSGAEERTSAGRARRWPGPRGCRGRRPASASAPAGGRPERPAGNPAATSTTARHDRRLRRGHHQAGAEGEDDGPLRAPGVGVAALGATPVASADHRQRRQGQHARLPAPAAGSPRTLARHDEACSMALATARTHQARGSPRRSRTRRHPRELDRRRVGPARRGM